MRALYATNLGLKFLLELAGVAAYAYAAGSLAHGLVAVVLAVAAAAVAIVLWGTFAAPKSKRRLTVPARARFELAFFALACAGLAAADHPGLAAISFALALANTTFLYAVDGSNAELQ